MTYTLSAFHPQALASQPMQVGDVLYFAPSSNQFPDGIWNYALATSGFEQEALGVVSSVDNCNGCFTLTINGYVSSGDFPSMLLPGSTYFLSMYTPGKTSTGNASLPSYVSKPIYTAISNNEIIVDIKRGAQVANFDVWP